MLHAKIKNSYHLFVTYLIFNTMSTIKQPPQPLPLPNRKQQQQQQNKTKNTKKKPKPEQHQEAIKKKLQNKEQNGNKTTATTGKGFPSKTLYWIISNYFSDITYFKEIKRINWELSALNLEAKMWPSLCDVLPSILLYM